MVASRQSRHCRALKLPPQSLLCSLSIPIKHTTTSASPCCSHRTHPRPLLATLSHGHRHHVRRRWGSTWPGGQGPPLVEPWLLGDAPGPVDAPRHFSSIVIDHRAGNRPFFDASAPFPSPATANTTKLPPTVIGRADAAMHAREPPVTPPPPFVVGAPSRRSAEPTSPPSSASGA
jgi:hypothetical protein